YERPGLELANDARAWLKRQVLPGNIRQLKNLVERTVLLATNSTLTSADFERHLEQSSQPAAEATLLGDISLEELEVRAIKRALALHDHNITAAARSLGITRSALYRRLQKFGIPYES
ncbi:MAG: helix-turn-helix domain-containing protein, partial [Lewinella sp.]|nr:helix-turn-helix domain-containing protein [Lewinella sp.]